MPGADDGRVDATITGDRGGHRVIVSVNGREIETPPVEHLLFYAGLVGLVALGLVEVPIAIALGVGHVLIDITRRPGLNALGEALSEA